MKKSLALLLCTVLTAGMLVGCGSDAAEETNTEAPAATEETEAEAEEDCHAIGMKFFRKKWKDKTVIISI